MLYLIVIFFCFHFGWKRTPFIAVVVDTNVIIIFKILVGWFIVLNVTFNNISVISRRSVLLVEETGVPGENHRPAASHCCKA
jgi:hypothetical protein